MKLVYRLAAHQVPECNFTRAGKRGCPRRGTPTICRRSMYRAFFSEGRPVSSLTFRRFATASPSYLFRPGLATAQAGPASVAVVVVVLEPEDHVARLRSVSAVAASVAPLAEVLVYVPHSVAVAELEVEDHVARLRSAAAVAASVVPLAVALSEVAVAAVAVSCAPIDCAELEVAVALLLSALVAALVFLLALPELAPVVELLLQRAQRSAVARAGAFADERLYCLELPQQRPWPFAACVLHLVVVQPDLIFELHSPVGHPGSRAFDS